MPKIFSSYVFAHVRSASEGTVNQINCYSFHHKNMLMMHNGGIKHVKAILNLLITNGERITGSRYLYQSRSLHFADGGRFECKNNKYILKDDSETEQRAILIVSEKLNKQDQEWKDIPANHFFTVNQTGNLKFTSV